MKFNHTFLSYLIVFFFSSCQPAGRILPSVTNSALLTPQKTILDEINHSKHLSLQSPTVQLTPTHSFTKTPRPKPLPTHKVACGVRIPLGRIARENEIVEIAIEHLAELQNVDRSQIEIIRVEQMEQENPFGVCGCPGMKQPDGRIPQPTTGYRILLAIGNELYEYQSHGFWLVFCNN